MVMYLYVCPEHGASNGKVWFPELMKSILWMQVYFAPCINVNVCGCIPCILRLSWYCIMKYSWLCCSFLRSFSVSWVNTLSSSNTWFIWWYFCDMLSINPPTGELDCQSQTHMSDNHGSLKLQSEYFRKAWKHDKIVLFYYFIILLLFFFFV